MGDKWCRCAQKLLAVHRDILVSEKKHIVFISDDLSLAAAPPLFVPVGVSVSLCFRSLNDSDSRWMNGMGNGWGKMGNGERKLGCIGDYGMRVRCERVVGLWAPGSGLWALGSGLWALGSRLWAFCSGL